MPMAAAAAESFNYIIVSRTRRRALDLRWRKRLDRPESDIYVQPIIELLQCIQVLYMCNMSKRIAPLGRPYFGFCPWQTRNYIAIYYNIMPLGIGEQTIVSRLDVIPE